jgi:hypothetical protein
MKMPIGTIIQIIIMILELIQKGLSEGEAILKASTMFNVPCELIEKIFLNK